MQIMFMCIYTRNHSIDIICVYKRKYFPYFYMILLVFILHFSNLSVDFNNLSKSIQLVSKFYNPVMTKLVYIVISRFFLKDTFQADESIKGFILFRRLGCRKKEQRKFFCSFGITLLEFLGP